jgi:hypothetical protein
MERVGWNAEPEEFLAMVALAYRHALRTVAPSGVEPLFREEASHGAFVDGLEQVCGRLHGPAEMLVVGCADDYLGCDARYAAEVLREVVPRQKIASVYSINLTRDDLHRPVRSCGGLRFDLVVSHSLLHFIPELGAVLRRIVTSLPESGMYLMAHEPNARFWLNQELLEERRRMAAGELARGRRQQLFSLAAYTTKLRLIVGWRPPIDLVRVANQDLRERHAFHAILSPHEMARIVDPHRPADGANEFRIGLNGFDARNLRIGPNRLAWARSYDHLGYVDYRGLPDKWARRNRELEQAYPDDGVNWTALWIVNQPA